MAAYTTVSARLDSTVKETAENVLRQLGISHSAAIGALYAQIALQGGLPFSLQLPKAEETTLPLGKIRKAVLHASEQYGVARAWLFGSYARGEATADSDVDILIEKGSLKGLQLGGFLDTIEQQLGVPVDVVTTSSLTTELKSAIDQDKVLLYES